MRSCDLDARLHRLRTHAGGPEGILFKGGAYLEELGRIRTFFFDKTGTLTLGKPEVGAVHPFRGRSEQEILCLAAAIESRSEHPLAEAVLDAARTGGSNSRRRPTCRPCPAWGSGDG